MCGEARGNGVDETIRDRNKTNATSSLDLCRSGHAAGTPSVTTTAVGLSTSVKYDLNATFQSRQETRASCVNLTETRSFGIKRHNKIYYSSCRGVYERFYRQVVYTRPERFDNVQPSRTRSLSARYVQCRTFRLRKYNFFFFFLLIINSYLNGCANALH